MMEKKKLIFLLFGPLSLIAMAAIKPFDMDFGASATLGMVIWMLTWWISEVVPMGVTSLLPILIFPLTGILSLEKTCIAYGNKYVFLFMGGFIIALAMEKWNLHRRMALNIVRRTGSGANHIILGFFLASYLISMWISNTATTLMMFPIASSVVALLLKKEHGHLSKGEKNFALTLMLAIAYGANIGGIATLVGSPPNAAAAGILSSETFQRPISFFDWLIIGLPFSLVLLILSYIFLVKVVYPNKLGKFDAGNSIINEELLKMGKTSGPEKRVFTIFILTALLWIGADPLAEWLKATGIIFNDVMIAVLSSVLLFIIPAQKHQAQPLLEWKDTERLPWGVLLMFGGGLALAEGFKESGLVDLITTHIQSLNTGNTFLFVTFLCFVGILMTALMSNLAMVNIFVPVVAALALGTGADPALFAIPVAISSSCDFMFPMSTPPNAIAYSSGYIKAHQMFRAGLVINLISFLLLSLVVALTV